MSRLQSNQGATLLDVVDKLRSLGSIRQDLSLPQIVVVGQQSSGKSSVLEAISGISFPTDEGQCTRFATEVILRRSQTVKRSISIHTVDNSEEKLSRIQRFETRWNEFQLEKLPEIIEDAKTVMNVTEESRFSEDILRLEVSGPEQDHLTLIDLPGLFVSTRWGQNSGDRELVDELVTRYMAKPRAIVLAVVSGKSDLENQNVLDKLKTVDRERKRTLGVITAPDMIAHGSHREAIFQGLADNRESPLSLGWHVLRNPSFEEKRDGADRNVLETETFKAKPWSDLPIECRGVSSLKKRLNRLLMQHISQELQGILKDVEAAIEKLQTELQKLGEERSTPDQQRLYLMNIAREFERLTSCAIEGEYRDDFFQNKPSNCLRAVVYNANLTYANIMSRVGHKWNITNQDFTETTMVKPPEWSHVVDPSLITKEDLSEEVHAMHRESRGRELPGTFQPALVGKLFRMQASKWGDLTKHHIDDVFNIVKDFFEVLLPHIAGEENSRSLLMHVIDPALEQRKKNLQAKGTEVLKPYLYGHPMTLNISFTKLLAKRRIQKNDDSEDEDRSDERSDEQHSNDLHRDDEVIDQMEAYYEVALGVVLDNIAILAVEQCLLDGLNELISPLTVVQESNDRLALLAAESEDTVSHRQKLKQRLKDYEEGRKAILPHVRRDLGRIAQPLPSIHPPTLQPRGMSSQTVEEAQRSRSQPPPSTQNVTQPAGTTFGSMSSSPFFTGGFLNASSTVGQGASSSSETATASQTGFGEGSRLFDFSKTPAFGQPTSTSSTATQLSNQQIREFVFDKAPQLRAYQSLPAIDLSSRIITLKRMPKLSGSSRLTITNDYGYKQLFNAASQALPIDTSETLKSFEEIRLEDWRVIHGRNVRYWMAFSEAEGVHRTSGRRTLAWRDYATIFDSVYQKQNPQEQSS